jgi:hypothetical protein
MIILGVGIQHAAWSSNWELLGSVRVKVKAEIVEGQKVEERCVTMSLQGQVS